MTTNERVGWPTPPAEAAYHGLARDIVRAIEPHSEADPIAILLQFLVAFGNAVGRSPHFMAEADRHGPNLYAVLVGETAKSRKGVSWGHARHLIEEAEPEWSQRVSSGLSSGEGLIWQVRNPQNAADGPGVTDKRLLVFEGEFASVLRVLTRDGNTLSAVMRTAWDTGNLSSLTKNNPARATGAHVSTIGHITREELLRYLDDTEAANGFGNRFLWACVERSKTLPEGGKLKPEVLRPLINRVRDALQVAKGVSELRRDEKARKLWNKVYPQLSEGKPGLLGAMTARAEAQVMRLACIYALLDQSSVIRAAHLQAALALWDYYEASARYIFGNKLGDPVAETILSALQDNPKGLSRTDIANLFSRHKHAGEIDRALARLVREGLARREQRKTGGRPEDRWFAV